MRATIAFNQRISIGYRHLGIAAAAFPPGFAAGSFVMVRPPQVGDPFLPRAFSIYRVSRTADAMPVVEILYKIVGKGTQYLAGQESGQEIELLGPLGKSFTPPPPDRTAVLVAGGIGVPPIAALARTLASREGSEVRGPRSEVRDRVSGVRCQVSEAESPSTVHGPLPTADAPRSTVHSPQSMVHGPSSMVAFLGGKTAEDILCVSDFKEVGIEPHITTEDGSLGTRGLITDLLGPFLAGPPLTTHHSPLTLYTCGPPGMLAAVARLAEGYGVPCQASVEANMACGFGACMGCAIETRSSSPGRQYKLVCKDGPVFDAREIAWGWESDDGRAASREPRKCGCHEP